MAGSTGGCRGGIQYRWVHGPLPFPPPSLPFPASPILPPKAYRCPPPAPPPRRNRNKPAGASAARPLPRASSSGAATAPPSAATAPSAKTAAAVPWPQQQGEGGAKDDMCVLALQQQFMQWLTRLLLGSMYPGSPYERKAMAIDLLYAVLEVLRTTHPKPLLSPASQAKLACAVPCCALQHPAEPHPALPCPALPYPALPCRAMPGFRCLARWAVRSPAWAHRNMIQVRGPSGRGSSSSGGAGRR